MKRAGNESTIAPPRIPLCKPYLSEDEELAVIEVLRSGWVMQGPKVFEFEELMADFVGVGHAVAVNSGTSALTLCLLAAGLEAGEKVVVPSHSFVATANAVLHVGGQPVFVDIGPDDYNLDPSKLEAAIEVGTRIVIVVHQYGFPADMEPIAAIAEKHNLILVEDAACSLGSTYHGKQTGTFGEAACLSFHPRKVITTGEGGMVLTDSDVIAERVRSLRNHGLCAGKAGAPPGCAEPGHNNRLTDVQAAMGIVQFKKLGEIVEQRSEIAARYMKAFEDLPAIRTATWPPDSEPNYQSFVAELVDDSINRDSLLSRLASDRIECVRGVQPIHLQPLYAEAHRDDNLPETIRAADRSFFLPIYPGMSVDEQDFVVSSLREALEKCSTAGEAE